MIKAPYNFVPINEKIFTPPNSEQISHDIPFSDGENGCITIRLTAASPVYVRNGGNWPKENIICNENPEYRSFSHFNKKFFIPGTSIKGMIRNVLEIMSLGKMGKGRINDHRFSYRDLSNSEDAEVYKDKLLNNVKAGWLQKNDDGKLLLTPCKYTKVRHTKLHDYYTREALPARTAINLAAKKSDTDYKNSVDKYNEWQQSLVMNFDIADQEATNLGTGNTEGTLVLTGQPSASKKKEFLFYQPDIDVQIDVSSLEKDFKFIHSTTHKQPNTELKYWLDSGKLEQGEMPVFYVKNGTTVHSLGLAMMYRLAFDYSVCDLLPEGHNNKELHDLADTVFGSIDGDALKGRIQFSHAFADNNAIPMETHVRVLGGPKASYSPTYLQDGETYRNRDARLAGHKRYPVHPAQQEAVTIKGQGGTDSTQTKFDPLQKGAEFVCKIRFHNLRKSEIGALLSALTFHGHEEELYHSLGMAKPLGCGKMKLKIEKIQAYSLTMANRQEYLEAFELSLEEEINEPTTVPDFVWARQQQLDELLTMAHEQNNKPGTPSELSYMKLNLDNNNDNEFAAARNKNEFLTRYSYLWPGIKRFSLRTVEDYIDQISTLLADNLINEVKTQTFNNDKALEALSAVLVTEDVTDAYNNLYKLVHTHAAIILKRIDTLRDNDLRDCIPNIRYSSNVSQELFDCLIFDRLEKRDFLNANNVPGWATSIEAGWKKLSSNDDALLDLFMLVNRKNILEWPQDNEIISYLKSNNKSGLLDLLLL